MLCPLNHWSKGNSSFLFFMPYTKFIQRVVNSYHFKKLSKCISQLQLKVNIYSKRTLSRNLWFQTWNDVVMLELTTVFFISMMFFFLFFVLGGEGQPCLWFFYSLTSHSNLFRAFQPPPSHASGFSTALQHAYIIDSVVAVMMQL